jgi:hypothetical protein
MKYRQSWIAQQIFIKISPAPRFSVRMPSEPQNIPFWYCKILRNTNFQFWAKKEANEKIHLGRK